MEQNLKETNFLTFKRYLNGLIGEKLTEDLITTLNGEWAVENASFGMSTDSGSAYDGSLVENALKIAKYACVINDLLPDELKRINSSIYKVALLSHISKVVMYNKNTNDWEIKNRGIIYKFSDSDIFLKCGERSLLICMNLGIKFTEEEFEAMRIMDRVKENDTNSSWHTSGVLATVIRQANELVGVENKNKANKN